MRRKFLSEYKAWILDFDGTLYYQLPLRICMATKLLAYYALHPRKISELILIQNYRQLREKLFAADKENFYILQLEKISEKYKISVSEIEKLLEFWFFEKPLPLIKKFQRKNLIESIILHQRQGVKMIVYSDYPVDKKISAVDFNPDYTFYSNDDLIKCMKPDSRGLKNILAALNLNPDEVLFIGDRDDRDGLCAKNAGVDYLNVKNFPK